MARWIDSTGTEGDGERRVRRQVTPMQFFEGSRTTREGPEEERDLAARRLAALALAVRQHEDTARRQSASPPRPHDGRLYRRLRQICGVGMR
jgi:hypothetical protein